MTFPSQTFRCSDDVLRAFPETVAVAFVVDDVTADAAVDATVEPLLRRAREAFDARPSAETEAVARWHRSLAETGLDSPRGDVHPLAAVCDAVARAHGIPVALFDLGRVSGNLELRVAAGDEAYIGESGAMSVPARGEVVIADEAGRALTRRWAIRPSTIAAVDHRTRAAMVVACTPEMVDPVDIDRLRNDMSTAVGHHWPVAEASAPPQA